MKEENAYDDLMHGPDHPVILNSYLKKLSKGRRFSRKIGIDFRFISALSSALSS